MNKTLTSGTTLAVANLVAVAAAPGQADAMSDFYKENRIRLAIGFSAAVGFDRGGRVAGRHIKIERRPFGGAFFLVGNPLQGLS